MYLNPHLWRLAYWVESNTDNNSGCLQKKDIYMSILSQGAPSPNVSARLSMSASLSYKSSPSLLPGNIGCFFADSLRVECKEHLKARQHSVLLICPRASESQQQGIEPEFAG